MDEKVAAQDGAIFLLHDGGQNFGADNEAPAHMLKQLSTFLVQCEETHRPFADPTPLL